jgi:endonuclease/exonuclease/phosphatase (EEP) superfamily protein YafD
VQTAFDITKAANPVRVMSVNLLSSNHENEAVFQAVEEAQPDLLIFLELNSWWHQKLQAQYGTTYPFHQSEVREDNFGISLYSKVPLQDFEILELEDQIPLLLASFENEGHPFHLLALHLIPPVNKRRSAQRDSSLAALPKVLASLPHAVMVVGDFNATPWSYPFRHLLAETELHDSSRGFGLQPTWPTYFPLLGIPIDHCLYSSGVRIVNREVGAKTGSDHRPLIVDFQVQ